MAIDHIISVIQSISENSNLVSKYGRFELGFFSPGSSKSRYVGIWYKNIPGFNITAFGYSKFSTKNENDDNSENYLWQNFEYLSDTLLPGMKPGWDLKIGLDWRLISWTNPDDLLRETTSGVTVIISNLSCEYYQSGPWIGLPYGGAPELKPNSLFNYEFFWNKDEVY
ncbi:S-locus-specific glycoprotein S6-like [Ziziphus jujuba]|uniref:S-locus-specific glycoprotein S6-like n=1 Tax=Ziziphus jujuba TaxID=326968 RepID=A0ABM3IPT4_ZIZJJ|nr:S-locus-specific glycoprotein S6-like [Ziziphus jujuba]